MSKKIIVAARRIHRELVPGFLESVLSPVTPLGVLIYSTGTWHI
ncbi:MAG TPA: hypothetical protein VMW09_08630 [Desulfatiglandales bacterium]|nr:hypothetical protein [Desulfatiglandales bacterium]